MLEVGDKVRVEGVKGTITAVDREGNAYRVQQRFTGSRHPVANWFPAAQVAEIGRYLPNGLQRNPRDYNCD